jgi:catechol 2,3-dioxygenase
MRLHIGHLALRTTDPERNATYLTEILGLRRTFESDDAIFLSTNDKHHEIEFLKGESAGVDHLGIEFEDETDLEHLRTAIVEAGESIVLEELDEPGISKGFRCTSPIGVTLELYVGMKRDPLSIANYMRPLARKFGHVSFGTTKPKEMERFLVDVLGFRVTDRLFDRCWMRADVEHHGVAVFESDHTFIHHYAFMLENFGVMQAYCDQLGQQGRPLTWGPGRHGPGRNLYTYLPDPDDIIVEAYADLLEVHDEANYERINWDQAGYEALNLWGPGPPADWREHGVPLLPPNPLSLTK